MFASGSSRGAAQSRVRTTRRLLFLFAPVFVIFLVVDSTQPVSGRGRSLTPPPFPCNRSEGRAPEAPRAGRGFAQPSAATVRSKRWKPERLARSPASIAPSAHARPRRTAATGQRNTVHEERASATLDPSIATARSTIDRCRSYCRLALIHVRPIKLELCRFTRRFDSFERLRTDLSTDSLEATWRRQRPIGYAPSSKHLTLREVTASARALGMHIH